MRHAFLIMAHCNFYILEKMVQILDNENVGIYIHVDKKAKNFNAHTIQDKVKKASLYFIERRNLQWGGIPL